MKGVKNWKKPYNIKYYTSVLILKRGLLHDVKLLNLRREGAAC